jgi:hypothetical protein
MAMVEDIESRDAPPTAETGFPLDTRQTRAIDAELSEIARRCAALVKHPIADHAALLYDEHGLPK